MRKILFALAAAALVSASMAADLGAVKPSDMKSVKPIRLAKVVMNKDGKVLMRSGWINYSEAFGIQRVGNLLWDCYEGDGTQAPDPEFPTDGLYGEQYFFDGAEGTRWIRRAANYKAPFIVRGIESMFPGTNGTAALGADIIFNQNQNEQFYYALFTSDDPLTTTPPDLSTFTGIIYDFGPLAPGFYFSNIDLTGSGLDHPTPADGRGSYAIILGQLYDETTGDITFSTEAQNGLWGTKPGNPSQVSRYGYQDGYDDSLPIDGVLDNTDYLDYKFWSVNNRQYNAADFAVTRGSQLGGNLASLQAVDGDVLRIQQRFQFAPTLANAEMTYGVTYPSDRDLTVTRTIRAYVTVRANSLPFSDNSCKLEIALRNWTTGTWVTKLVTKPTSTLKEIYSYNINLPDNVNFVRASDRRVEVRVGVYHLQPISPAWEMGVDQANVFFAYSGPIPLAQSVAFSAP